MSAEPQPTVKPYDFIYLGRNDSLHRVRAVVSTTSTNHVEAVFSTSPKRHVAQNIKWVDDHWELIGVDASYAEGNSRLQPFVSALSNGR